MRSLAPGWISALLVVTCASACSRDNWTYDAQVDAADVQAASDGAIDTPSVDASIDASATDAPTDGPVDAPTTDTAPDTAPDTRADVPAVDVPAVDVPAMDVTAMDVTAMDVTAMDVTTMDARVDVPPTDARADVSVDATALDAPVDVPLDVRAPDAPQDITPRPIAPISLGNVTQRRPTLRWQLPSRFDGAVLELCRDRACTMVIETRTVTGSTARPTADLPARSVVFWRLRGRMGSTTDAAYSPTWLFHVPATSASTSVDSSAHPHLDVNGDGYDDVVVGAKNVAVRSLTQMGAVSVFHGGPSGTAMTADRLLESPGISSGDTFGFSVAGVGDVNGDGYGDLIVGAPGADPRGLGQAGAAYVFHGSAAGIAATATRVLEGTSRSIEFGRAAAGAGDVNGDGYADLLVGAPYATAGGHTNAGAVSVFLGSADGTVAAAARVLVGSAMGDLLGVTVAGAGDVNGDGFDDILIGAPYATRGERNNTGAASVYLGSTAGIGTGTGLVFEGAVADDLFASSLGGAGDVNGDGYDDIVVGASRASPGGMVAAGTASVYLGGGSGLSTSAVAVITGDAGDVLGSAVAGAGDVNGDGYDDLAIGAQRGIVRVFHGMASGVAATAARALSGVDWNVLSVAGAGDVNRDGYDDLVIGTQNTNTMEFNFVGSARVFQGSATGVGAGAARTYEGAAEGDGFGNAVACWCEGRSRHGVTESRGARCSRALRHGRVRVRSMLHASSRACARSAV